MDTFYQRILARYYNDKAENSLVYKKNRLLRFVNKFHKSLINFGNFE